MKNQNDIKTGKYPTVEIELQEKYDVLCEKHEQIKKEFKKILAELVAVSYEQLPKRLQDRLDVALQTIDFGAMDKHEQ